MKADFWHERWKTNEIHFHEKEANPLLVRHLEALALKPGSRVFIPLCGKTLDIAWLLARGHQVVGAELSADAVEQLLTELGMEPERSEAGKLTHYRAEHLDIFVGDIFDLTQSTLGAVDAVYDRAALVALPEDMRPRYARHVTDMTRAAPQLLISYEYDQSLLPGPPFAVFEDEIAAHYEGSHEKALLEREEMAGGLKGRCPAVQSVWLLRPKKKPKPKTGARWPLAGLSLTMLLSSLGTSVANVALPTLARGFGASFQAVQWVVLAYLLSITVLIVGAGRLGDLIGRQRLLMAGIVIFTIASVLAGFAHSLNLLIAARAVQGLGAAVMMALTLATIHEAAPKMKTGRAMGLMGAMSAVGTALGPTLGGALIALVGWRAIFFINAPLGLLAFMLVRRSDGTVKTGAFQPTTAFDYRGMSLLAFSLAAYALAMTVGRGHFGWNNVALLVAATLGVAGFVTVQRRTPSPLIPLSLLRDQERRRGLATSALVATVLMTSLVVGPFYLAHALGHDPASVGLILSAGPLVVALAGVPAGKLVDQHGARRMTAVGLASIAAGTLTLAMLPISCGVPGYVLPTIVMTAGYALFQTANNTAVMSCVRSEERGLVSGLLNLSRNLGLITGSSAISAWFTLASGVGDLASAAPESVAQGMRAAFGLAFVLTLAAGTIALQRRRSQSMPNGVQPC